MRVFLGVSFILTFILSVGPVQAAEDAAGSPVREEKILNNKRNYTARDLPQEEAVEKDTVKTKEDVVTEPQECTAEDRIKLGEYNKVMSSYYQDVKFIQENVDKLETTKELEILQKNSEVYMGFISSDEYPAYLRMQKRCHETAPPLPFDWPEWVGLPNPFTNPDR